MNYCPYCGNALTDASVQFCSVCGKPLPEIPAQKSDLPEDASSGGDGYDGYYEDVHPADEGERREGIDTELVKKIALLSSAALLIIGACVLLMLLL